MLIGAVLFLTMHLFALFPYVMKKLPPSPCVATPCFVVARQSFRTLASLTPKALPFSYESLQKVVSLANLIIGLNSKQAHLMGAILSSFSSFSSFSLPSGVEDLINNEQATETSTSQARHETAKRYEAELQDTMNSLDHKGLTRKRFHFVRGRPIVGHVKNSRRPNPLHGGQSLFLYSFDHFISELDGARNNLWSRSTKEELDLSHKIDNFFPSLNGRPPTPQELNERAKLSISLNQTRVESDKRGESIVSLSQKAAAFDRNM